MPDLTTYTWRFISSATPGQRTEHTMVGIGDKVFLFGGAVLGIGYVSDSWTFALDTWTQVFPDTAPSDRVRHAMAWDGSRVLLFGGQDIDNNYLDDTWSYDPGLNEWTQLSATSLLYSPSTSVRLSKLAWDSDNSRFLLFIAGFDDFYGEFNHIWKFESDTWTRLTPADTPTNGEAGSRLFVAFAYGLGGAVLFGGKRFGDFDSSVYFGQGPTWDFVTNWIERITVDAPGEVSSTRVHGRWGGTLVFDNDAEFLWFGGERPSVGALSRLMDNRTWMLQADNWVELLLEFHPSSRTEYGMAWLDDENRFVLYGGYAEGDLVNGVRGDTWVFEGPEDVPPPPDPPPPEYHTLSRRINYKGQWNNSLAYETGDAVTHNRETFLCIQANTGEEPDDA